MVSTRRGLRSDRVREHIRHNVVGYIALFCFAVGGTAIAGNTAPTNSVVSKSIKDGQVKKADVNANDVQLRVGGTCAVGEAIRAINEDGTVACETDDAGGQPTGAAGGDLTGSYPNPEVGFNKIGGAELIPAAEDEIIDGTIDTQDIRNGSVTGADINRASVPGLPQVASVAVPQDQSVALFSNGPLSIIGDCKDGEAPAVLVKYDSATGEAFYSSHQIHSTSSSIERGGPITQTSTFLERLISRRHSSGPLSTARYEAVTSQNQSLVGQVTTRLQGHLLLGTGVCHFFATAIGS